MILILLTLALIGAASYLIFQNQKIINRTQQETQSPPTTTQTQESPPTDDIELSTPSPSPSPSPSTFQLTLSLTQNAIKTNVSAKNYQGLIAYMTTPKIFVVLQATECCGDQTPQEAAEQMKYVDSGIPFDFNQESETVKNLKSKNPQLSDKFIGISTVNEYMVAFGIDNENHISNIEMSASYKLYNQ